ncbi:DNA breaking-rejoining enzyme [Mycena crocata]|nr:DNA breaking-rejoining enzyme [Mycena crocata]
MSGTPQARELARAAARRNTSNPSTIIPIPRASESSTSPTARLLQGRYRKPRKPRAGCEYSPSVYRPMVLAHERIQKWETPCTKRYREAQSQASPLGFQKFLEVMLLGLDENTRSNYGAGLLRYTQYCDTLSISEEARMPASAHLLVMFASDAAGYNSHKTVSNWLAGLKVWHDINGAEWNGDSPQMKRVKTGIKKLVPPTSIQPKRPPVTIEHMYALYITLDLSNCHDAAIWAVACIAFWGCCRLGELLPSSQVAFHPSRHVTRGEEIHWETDEGRAVSTGFHIPWTKVTKEEGADLCISEPESGLSTQYAMRQHLHANSKVPAHASLFAYEKKAGGYHNMTKTEYLARVNGIWQAKGLLKVNGHSARIGGATELLLRGVHPDVVAQQGRWSSHSFLLYWRKIQSILPLFINREFAANRVAQASKGMGEFIKKYGLQDVV